MRELVETTDRMTLAKRAVELAREHLGLERCSLWLREGDTRRGTWGTDIDGQTVDEQDQRAPIGDYTARIVKGDRAWGFLAGPHWVDDGGRRVQHDWAAVTPLRCHGRTTGVFYNDCAISGAAPDPDLQDQVALYVGVVAQLAERLQRLAEAQGLASLAATLTALSDVGAMAQAVADQTHALLDWDAFCLACLSDDGQALEQVGVADADSSGTICRPGRRIPMESFSPVMAPLCERKSLLLRNPTAEDVHPACPGVGLASAFYQPIVSRDRLIGVMLVASDVPDRYSARECELLGAVAAIVSQTLDRINETRRAAAAAAEHEALISAIPDLILVYDRDARCVAVPSPERLASGRTLSELLGQRVTDVFGSSAQPVADAVRRAVDDGECGTLHYELQFDNRRAWMEGRYVPLGDHVLWIARDITDRVKAEGELREAQVALAYAAELAQVGAFTHDLRDDLLTWSQSMCRLHGLPDDVLVLPLAEVAARFGHGEDGARLLASVREAMVSCQRISMPMRFLRADGAVRHGRMVADVRRDSEGRPTHMVGMMQDVTDQVEQQEQRLHLEAQLAQAGKMEAIGQLAGGVAHDFNNLLTSISGYAELLLGEVPQDSAQRADLDEIHRAAQRAASLTRQLLAFSRRSLIKPVVVDLNELVQDMERMLRRLIGEHIEVVVTLAPEPLHLLADPGQVEQIVMNLVVNARDAMANGGRLTLTTAAVMLSQTDLGPMSDVEPGAFVRLTVSDTGVGMSAEVRERAFEPFYTTKPLGEGTGLGLSTVYGAVRQNRGHITCASEEGEGSSFDIYLPRLSQAGQAANQPETPPPGGHECLLLAEDDHALRALASRLLRHAGYRVIEAANADEALRLAADEPVDLLITDVIMPGMNGRELAVSLRTQVPGLKVLFVSGYTASILAQQGLAPDQCPLLVKPFSRRELLERVRGLLDS